MTAHPLFVLGVEHSGTTILYRMLARHPEFAWFSQFSLRGGNIPERGRLPLFAAVNRWGRAIFAPTWRKEWGLRALLVPSPDEAHRIWNYVLPDVRTYWTTDDYEERMGERIVRISEEECRNWRRARLLVKLPRLSRAVGLLSRVFPDGRFVHIIRDGKAVALSNRHKFARSPWGDSVALRESALYWKALVDHVESTRELLGERLITLKYESLCGDVDGTIESVLRHAGLTRHEVVDGLPKTLMITNERQYERCSPEEKAMLDDTLGPSLEALGYARFTALE